MFDFVLFRFLFIFFHLFLSSGKQQISISNFILFFNFVSGSAEVPIHCHEGPCSDGHQDEGDTLVNLF
jgi:hypothetical protein